MPAVPLSQVAVQLRPEDNVAVAARPLAAGLEIQVNGRTITVDRRIGLGHKVALRAIKQGEAILKYGQVIGFAGQDIAPGVHVHVHNVKADAFERDYAFCQECPPPPLPPGTDAPGSPAVRSWQGYDRGPDRAEHLRYGSRNYIAIISTVNCSASTNKYIVERLRRAAS